MARRGGDRSTLAARALTIERERDILQRRIKGASTAAIAAALGFTQRGVQLAIVRALTKVDLPGAVEAKKAMLARLDLLREKLFARLDQEGEDLATVARAVVTVEAREASLLGLDMPEKLILAHLNEPPASDENAVANLQRLTPDELRTLLALTQKTRGQVVETTGVALPEAPDFPDDENANDEHKCQTVSMSPPPNPQPPRSPIGETEAERDARLAANRPTPFDDAINELEDQLGFVAAADAVNRTRFQARLADLRRQRAEYLVEN